MLRRRFLQAGTAAGLAASARLGRGIPVHEDKGTRFLQNRFLLDMVHISPGEPAPATAFLNPRTLAANGYTGQVILSLVEGVPVFDGLGRPDAAPDAASRGSTVGPRAELIPAGSPARFWAERTAAHIDGQIAAAHAAGLQCFAWMQLIVFPAAVVQAWQSEICDPEGRVDIARPRTQALLRMQLAEVFARFPKLDGLLIRTGEVYLHDLPFHASTNASRQQKMQGSSAILHDEASHVTLLGLLREEICVRRARYVFYRTWDFGEHFHVNPAYYLRVTGAIEPHPKLLFSVKHQKGDFHQLTPFNPTLTIGRHRQIVEVQCQREAYGKGAHPYYIGAGVIDGWEEMSRLMKPGERRGLRDIVAHPLYAGTWTWSRGGGWEGPYIADEMWCALNVYVISRFAADPTRTEPEIFAAYAHSLGLRGADAAAFREMQELSTKGVLRGQLTLLPVNLSVWWTRDDKFADPDLSDFLNKGLVEAALEEKVEAGRMWARMAVLADEIHWKDAGTREFVRTSVAYGGFKFAVIRAAWTVLLLGRAGAAGTGDKPRIREALAQYDAAWLNWRALKQAHPSCASLYKDVAFADKSGLGAAVDKFRSI